MVKIENKKDCLYGVYKYLPPRICSALRLFCLKYQTLSNTVTEIRLREAGAFSVSVNDKNMFISEEGSVDGGKMICTADEINECVSLLCNNSYQSHEEEIEDGYISLPEGFRVGVAVSASAGGRVYGINSVCIRIPHEIEADCDELFSEGVCSMLIYSPPAVGKTTLLRICIKKLCEMGIRVAVIDTRAELKNKNPPPLADYICGIERGRGIENATRTLSPQVIVCDEIGSVEESKAILAAQNTGVPFIASAHAHSLSSLLLRPNISLLAECHVFDKFVGLSRKNNEFVYDITLCNT